MNGVCVGESVCVDGGGGGGGDMPPVLPLRFLHLSTKSLDNKEGLVKLL